jgi:hypothetical protein
MGAKTSGVIALKGLNGEPFGELCNAHRISQVQASDGASACGLRIGPSARCQDLRPERAQPLLRPANKPARSNEREWHDGRKTSLVVA